MSLVLGVLGVISTPLFGLFTALPAAAAVTGAVALRATHREGLRGRACALWGFGLGAFFFVLDVGLLALGIVGMRMGA